MKEEKMGLSAISGGERSERVALAPFFLSFSCASSEKEKLPGGSFSDFEPLRWRSDQQGSDSMV
jgi:hypothetical protein